MISISILLISSHSNKYGMIKRLIKQLEKKLSTETVERHIGIIVQLLII